MSGTRLNFLKSTYNTKNVPTPNLKVNVADDKEKGQRYERSK